MFLVSATRNRHDPGRGLGVNARALEALIPFIRLFFSTSFAFFLCRPLATNMIMSWLACNNKRPANLQIASSFPKTQNSA